jgi:hypothetical protein
MWTGDIKGLNYIHITILHNVFSFASTVHAHRAMLQKLKTQSYIIMRSLFDVHDINAHRADQIRLYFNKILPGFQPRQVVKSRENRRFEDHLRPRPQGN